MTSFFCKTDEFFQKNSTDSRKKHTTYALEWPEPKSKEFDFPTYNTKALADLKDLIIKAFEISAMDAIVRYVQTDRKFWGKNKESYVLSKPRIKEYAFP